MAAEIMTKMEGPKISKMEAISKYCRTTYIWFENSCKRIIL